MCCQFWLAALLIFVCLFVLSPHTFAHHSRFVVLRVCNHSLSHARPPFAACEPLTTENHVHFPRAITVRLNCYPSYPEPNEEIQQTRSTGELARTTMNANHLNLPLTNCILDSSPPTFRP